MGETTLALGFLGRSIAGLRGLPDGDRPRIETRIGGEIEGRNRSF